MQIRFSWLLVQVFWIIPAFVYAQAQDTKPPKVVLLGDSIRLSYTPYVTKQLEGQVQVVSPKPNGGDSSRLLANLEEWAIREQPAIVHFNCGIHDVKKIKSTGQFQVSPEQYEANLRKIVDRLRKETMATVLFALTTPIVDDRASKSRMKVDYELLEASALQYNQIALRVMKELNVPVTDTRAALGNSDDWNKLVGADGIHLSPNGYQKIGIAVATAVRKQLPTALKDK